MGSRVQLVIACVPHGADNARTAREIWKSIGMWSDNAVNKQLRDLAEAGRLQRRQEEIPGHQGFRWLYWREAV